MLTPVRVRGKNKRSKPGKNSLANQASGPTSVPPRPPGRPKKPRVKPVGQPSSDASVMRIAESPDAKSCKEPSLSHLERLPLELLQTIFLHCPNLALPRASPLLSSALSSKHLRTKLVLQVFSVSQGKGNGELQSELLGLRWMTFEFLRECQQMYFIKNITDAYRMWNADTSSEEQASDIGKIEKSISIYCSRLRGTKETETARGELGWKKLQGRTTSGNNTQLFEAFKYDGERFGVKSCEPENRLLVHTCPKEYWPSCEKHWNHSTRTDCPRTSAFWMLFYDKDCQIPEKLLHGPWTEEKGDFLKKLLDAGLRIDFVNSTRGEVASQGVKDAIRENNSPAVNALLTGTKLHVSDYRYEGWLDGLEESQQTPPFKAPWILPNGASWFGSNTVGVIPTKEHLRIAILEMGCNIYITSRLLDTRYLTGEEITDDEEFVLWALAKKEAGDFRGQWLLDRLERERRRRIDALADTNRE